ncbi:MAG: FtsQ-type POTRA domain-containing protein, partial [Candidatus Bathyarchaeota archaeon]|nr:FtsQ-type POTRA domain-containing protein [Candidatus Bathyarchaeota archaeon]
MSDSIRNILGQNLNFFLLNSSYIVQEIRDSLPKIEDIQIQREFPDKIFINITEKKAIGIVCIPGNPETCF